MKCGLLLLFKELKCKFELNRKSSELERIDGREAGKYVWEVGGKGLVVGGSVCKSVSVWEIG